ncbi:MAG: membrane protein insertase YidC [Campylobacter sp.]|nr:membrane protein insertase YidC [Campylobacter sp.]
MENLSQQKRILLATVLSILFFVAYDYFFIPKVPPQDLNQSSVQTQTQNIQTNSQNQAPQDKQNPVAPITTNKSEELVKIKAKNFEASIDIYGRISEFYLNEEKFRLENGERTQLAGASPLALELRFSDQNVNNEAFNTSYTADKNSIELTNEAQSITLTQKLKDLSINKKITFYPNGRYEVVVSTSKNIDYFITPGFRPNVIVDGYTVHGALLQHADEKLEILEDDDINGNEIFDDINIAAASDRYYTTLLYNFDTKFNVYMNTDAQKNSLVFIKANGEFKAGGYIGPKDHKLLTSIDARLGDVVEYGWFTFIAKPMFKFLDFLNSHIGNWGWAIVIFTLIIRIILFPLTYKGMLSMNKMKELAPKMKELQAKYKGDPQKLNASVMELYRKNGANPMGGCLPILLQIPIFFAIYRVLLNAIELKGAEWILWINDLSLKDPYFVLPILMAVTMFLQQKITPTNFTDPMQEKIMKFLPLIFLVFFVTFPAGLTLYWFVNNVCSVIQQIFVNKLFEKHKEVKA